MVLLLNSSNTRDHYQQDLLVVIDVFYNWGIINDPLNETYISLISKKLDSKSVSDCHPISLVPCAYKTIACVLSNRLKHVLHTIAENKMILWKTDKSWMLP